MSREKVLIQDCNAGLNSTFVGSQPPDSLSDDSSWNRWLHHSLERLHKRHLLRHGVYIALRRALPLAVLAIVWFMVVHEARLVEPQGFLNASVSFRHLLLALGIVVVWNYLSNGRPRWHLAAAKRIRLEIWCLVRASVGCGFLLFIANALHSKSRSSAELGLLLTEAFLAGSFLLLLGAFFVSGDLISYPLSARKTLIIGTGPRASSVRTRARSGHERLEILGCLDNTYLGSDPVGDNYRGNLDTLPALLKDEPVELVLIGLPVKSHYKEIQHVIEVCEAVGVEAHYMVDVFATKRSVQQKPPAPTEFVVLGDPTNHLHYWVKRIFDLLITIPVLLALVPVMAVIGIAIKLTSPGPVFFVQQRYGRSRQRFSMYKFRTMVVDAERQQTALEALNEAEGPVFKLRADPRVTKVGSFLRRTSLDELPQFFNVLRGEMSLVGPRPLPLRDVSLFDETWLLRRFSVRPGLTCLWQVRGRSNTKFAEWIKLDLEYIDRWSLGLDFIILIQTIPAVLRGSGAM